MVGQWKVMQWGLSNSFLKDFTKMSNCKNVNVTFFCEDMPFLGGSLDMIISCDCCSRSCLEVKYPFSIRNISPMDTEVKLPYLSWESEQADTSKVGMSLIDSVLSKSFRCWQWHMYVEIEGSFWVKIPSKANLLNFWK